MIASDIAIQTNGPYREAAVTTPIPSSEQGPEPWRIHGENQKDHGPSERHTEMHEEADRGRSRSASQRLGADQHTRHTLKETVTVE